jgi:alginate O-acetyltransferase complex protein AlgI
MVFSSAAFLFGFLPLFLLLYFATPARWRNLTILVASLLFYFVDAGLLTLILGGSIVFNHFAGRAIHALSGRNRKLAVAGSIAVNLVPLLYYKYWMFFLHAANDVAGQLGAPVHFAVVQVLLPAGVSFFTFHAISYVVDIHRGKVRPAGSLVDFGMYMANFPQLIAGPIVRYSEIEDVVRTRPTRWEQVNLGVFTFVLGLAKKIVLADNAGRIADAVFALPADQLNPGLAWLGAFAYAMQIFFDFSGYSDMAIGLGRMMGFEFPRNFDQPYRSRSVTEFWRRWHMTLSRWFRDYVYIPLGGNRAGPVRTLFNLLAVFFLCGLWHGAAYGFVVWGLYHGALLMIERVLKTRFDFEPAGIAGQVATFVLVTVGWVFFRAPTLPVALDHLQAMAGLGASEVLLPFTVTPDQGVLLALAAVCAVFPVERLRGLGAPALRQGVLASFAVVALAYSGMLIAANGFHPFIYFRF